MPEGLRSIVAASAISIAYKPISDLARMQLVDLLKKIDTRIKKCEKKMDAYSRAHLHEVSMQITQALKAGYTYNAAAPPSMGSFIILGETVEE